MNIFSKIKLLWAVKNPIENIVQEATMPKAGYKTTEFWLIVVTNLLTVAGALQGMIPKETSAIILSVLNGFYGVLRTIAKKDISVTTPT